MGILTATSREDVDIDVELTTVSYVNGSVRLNTLDADNGAEHGHAADSENVLEITDEYPDGGIKAYTVVLGSFLGALSNLGVINSIGAVQAYVSQNQLKNVKITTVSWIFSIFLALAYAVGLFIGPIFDRHGAKGLLLVSALLTWLGFFTAGESTSVWQLILSISICSGIGTAVGMTPIFGVTNHWFLTKRGNANGIATSGGSVGAIALPLLLRYLYSTYGFKWAMRILAFFCLACTLAATALVEERLRKTKEVEEPAESAIETSVSGSTSLSATDFGSAVSPTLLSRIVSPFKFIGSTIVDTITGLSFRALREYKYTFLICGSFCGELGLILIITYFATYAMAQGVSESKSYIMLSLWNATGILGRLLPGYASDKLGRFNVTIITMLGLDISILLLWLPFGSSEKVLYAFAGLGGFFLGLIFSLLPSCIGQISPVREFGERFGLVVFFLSFGNLIGVPIGAAIIGDESKHNYDMFVVLVAVLESIGILFWCVSRYFIVGTRINVKV